MSSELIPLANITQSKYADDAAFSTLSSGNFLPRLQLMNSGSDPVKLGKINQGHYGLVRSKDTVEDLTREAPVLAFAWRPKALDMSGDTVISVFNPKSAEFLRIQNKSEEQNSRCMYGPEFLVWVPSVESWATFFFGNPTMRRVAAELKALMNKSPALLRSNLIRGKVHSWFGPVISIYSQGVKQPDQQEAIEVINKFNNPPETETEEVAEDAVQRDR